MRNELMTGPLPREIQNQFNIIQKIGSGGFGAVYLVQDKNTGSKKALKILNKDYSNREVLQRFRMEYLGLKKYGTEYSVEVEDFIEVGEEFLGVIMEYIPFGLLEWVNEHPEKSQLMSFEIIKAVYSFHANTVAHRDLKPETVLYMPPEVLFLSPPYQKIKEFREASLRLNKLAERFKDIRQRGIAQRLLHDVFSLGMILLILNHEKLRVLALENPNRLVEEYLEMPSGFVNRYLTELDRDFQQCIKRAIEFFPDKRFENAGLLLKYCSEIFGIEAEENRSRTDVFEKSGTPAHIIISPIHDQQIYCISCKNTVIISQNEIPRIRFCPYCRAELHHQFTISSFDKVVFKTIDTRADTLGNIVEYPVHSISKILIQIGRDESNDIIFHDRSVSRHHAILILETGKFAELENLNPKNPTLLNDEILNSYQLITLHGRDTIQLGFLSYINYDIVFKKRD